MIYYTWPQTEGAFELYDMEDDQEEIHDLYASLKSVANPMREELLDSLASANHKYQN